MRQKQSIFSLFLLSPSSRRAWIEITRRYRDRTRCEVALLAEGVDRNLPSLQEIYCSPRRPPRGGRG